MRYKAPEHTTEIFLSGGPLRADKDGYVNAADDLPDSDAVALCRAGFLPAPRETKGKIALSDKEA